ncbi:MAG: hypothetical protein IAG13_01830, partial [Deltaproteobacteria bacterium]|nr:hypothetical protein [Nannocystaceae bacterium]
MGRTSYEPPRWGEAAAAGALAFERVARSEPIPWVLAGAAANSMPAPLPEDELTALREQAFEQGL